MRKEMGSAAAGMVVLDRSDYSQSTQSECATTRGAGDSELDVTEQKKIRLVILQRSQDGTIDRGRDRKVNEKQTHLERKA
jgi:hypothetical protein